MAAMKSPCAKRKKKKTVFLLIFVMACMVLPGYSSKHKTNKEEVNPTAKLELAIEHFREGSTLYGQRKLDEAIGEYREALRSDPQEPYWHQALGKALEDKGDLQGALNEDWLATQESPLDSGLRSKYEELADKLHVNIEHKRGETTATPGEPFEIGGEVTAPIPTYKPEPPYPERARKAKYQGSTVIWIVVDAHGNVASARVEKPLGVGLDEATLETILTWKFKPATRGGVPVPVRVKVEISFRTFL
jgi:TonB family protein